jgi:hypothetical protein
MKALEKMRINREEVAVGLSEGERENWSLQWNLIRAWALIREIQ